MTPAPANNLPELSFVVSSQGVRIHLERILNSFLDLNPALRFEVLVGSPHPLKSASDLVENLLVQGVDISWVQVPGKNLSLLRNSLFKNARGRWVYFVDEDCALPTDFIWRLAPILKSGEGKAFGGFYHSPNSRKLFQRAYNSMANLWLKVHLDSQQPVVLAGNMVIPKIEPQTPEFPFSLAQHFGGEEVALSEILKRHGISIRHSSQLSMPHHCSHTPMRFFSRALLHGRSAYRSTSLNQSMGVVVKHFVQEKNILVNALVISYLVIVRLARAQAKMSASKEESVYVSSELSQSLDSFPGL